ncbi:prepilin-type N-terminal cleavage/methylation domain-containing protein [Photobacterium halotolerans]|uniref:prepilin-type N-terminal cleavage/methylation domain-containing protein n=1 Tax=Photobacterium halotolerans TaxID=265726 RepID=UPI000406E4E7|nr:prepilin-type N-terminal cleavage/methylation domain-containing protein [Photobacterium halotolerans]
MTQYPNRQAGLSLIELVIVVVVVCILALVAVPRFIDIAEEAKAAALQGMAGSFSTAVFSVRTQWEADGKPGTQRRHWVNYNGILFNLTGTGTGAGGREGYPFALQGQGSSQLEQLSEQDCLALMDNLLQNPPPSTTDASEAGSGQYQYFVEVGATSGNRFCRYYQLASASDFWTGKKAITAGHYFTYIPALGRVDINIDRNI